jgi:hypothetical protein
MVKTGHAEVSIELEARLFGGPQLAFGSKVADSMSCWGASPARQLK